MYVGFVVGLDYADPRFKPFEAFQQFKNHPSLKPLFDGGELLAYGARTIVEGGWQSMPTFEMPGALLVGDAGGTLNVTKIKGVHQAVRSGVLAAEHLAEAREPAGFDPAGAPPPARASSTRSATYAPGSTRACGSGSPTARSRRSRVGIRRGRCRTMPIIRRCSDSTSLPRPIAAGAIAALKPRDRVSAVFFAGNTHEESQPVHLKVHEPRICVTRCAQSNMAIPASISALRTSMKWWTTAPAVSRLQINASNCVHCKACDIKDPYEIITWTTPEGGSGPNYPAM
jgi:electron-transferring-flavoprotein dehydrogenase